LWGEKIRFLKLLKQTFESSSGETAQYREFYFAFKADMTRLLKDKVKRLEFHKMHFEVSGFLEANNSQVWYLNTGDVRLSAQRMGMLIRTAKDFKDYIGGPNGYINYDEHFAEKLLAIIEKAPFQQI
jgi:hypothetical protein